MYETANRVCKEKPKLEHESYKVRVFLYPVALSFHPIAVVRIPARGAGYLIFGDIMAGDWIPIEFETPRKQEVLGIARRTGMSRYEVIGVLVDIWCWASAETVDGHVDANVDGLVSLFAIDRSFFDAMIKVGWLKVTETGLFIPNANHWLTVGAKARLIKSRRQSEWRSSRKTVDGHVDGSVDGNVDTKTSTTEEKRREYINTTVVKKKPVIKYNVLKPYSARFEEIWKVYPNSKCKFDAWKEYQKLNPDDSLHNTMLKAVLSQNKQDQWTKDEGKFIPHFRKWLHGRQWEEEVKTVVKSGIWSP